MPFYDYECLDCHKASEIFVNGPQKPECPHCGSKNLEKQLPTFHTKGSKGSGHTHSGGCCGGHCGCGHHH
ncbi:MAG: zinc ribbon domain-containing protein [Puniceicoccales bacterium]|jgi:putative FmdB family regulatory protein|nr:zinc ribbon domain-containing protein [Puniceicoccales bacterium]